VSSACDRIFERLQKVHFEVAAGSFKPFDQRLPFIVGAAWDARTAQLALIVEIDESQEEEAWRQVLFGAAGLRHHLATDGPAALGPPLVLMVVDAAGEQKVRALVEDMSQHYAIFARVDLSLVRRDQISDDEILDDALAPLLPRCRDAREWEISKRDVLHFWERLRATVRNAAAGLDDVFAEYRKTAGDVISERLIGDLADRPELSSPAPLSKLRLRGFRSFADEEFELPPVSVLHGTNGSGKSAVLEALELCWAGTSQRKPPGVEPAEYGRHLPRGGRGEFEVAADGPPITEVLREATAELVRCVLTQDAVSDLVDKPPEERYEWLLAITGLELPEVDQRTDTLVREAKKEADGVLRDAGLSPLKAINSDGLKHLQAELRGSIVSGLPSRVDLLGAEELLTKASHGGYARQNWKQEGMLHAAVEAVDEMVASTPFGTELDAAILDGAAREARKAADFRRKRARPIALLVDAIRSAQMHGGEVPRDEPEDQPLLPPIPRRLAVRWLSHGRGLEEAAKEFHAEAGELDDEDWSTRLDAYAEALEAAAASILTKELEEIAGAVVRSEASPAPVTGEEVPEDRYRAAGFQQALGRPLDVAPTLEEYADLLQRQAAELEALAAGLDDHPSRGFAAHAERVLGAVCRFEVARRLRPRKGYKSPIAEASESVVTELLQGRLAPVVRELLAALVRFEWYFKPPVISGQDRQLVLGGISTDRADLDARLMLNAAERNVVGLSWFLALHLLQPRERRRVLAIDDASAAFDLTNQAAFVSTLRAFVRLLQPEQVVVITHDTAIAESLTEELAPVGDWPASIARIRCERSKEDVSVSRLEERHDSPRDLRSDLERLGLMGEMHAPA
jgi:AAA domain